MKAAKLQITKVMITAIVFFGVTALSLTPMVAL